MKVIIIDFFLRQLLSSIIIILSHFSRNIDYEQKPFKFFKKCFCFFYFHLVFLGGSLLSEVSIEKSTPKCRLRYTWNITQEPLHSRSHWHQHRWVLQWVISQTHVIILCPLPRGRLASVVLQLALSFVFTVHQSRHSRSSSCLCCMSLTSLISCSFCAYFFLALMYYHHIDQS